MASDDPPSSLNAPGRSLGRYHPQEAAQELALLEDRARYLALACAASAEGRNELGSGTQSDLLPHIGSNEEAVCPAVGEVAENRVLCPRNPGTDGGQAGMGVADW